MVEDAGLVLVWETLNVLVNHPGYFLVYSADGADLVHRTDRPSVKFLFDIYHQQISEGNLINNIRKYHQEIGHYHFADNPGRHEPGTGEINYQNVFKAIYETGYRDIVACEFGKLKSTEEVLKILAQCDRW
jgi:hydroxypyruvate isomerase